MDNPEKLATLSTHDTGLRKRKLKGQSRMDNPETLETLSTQDTGLRQRKPKGQSRETGNN